MSDRARDTRISMILSWLTRRGELQVRLLAPLLGVSGATVRRDLAVMEEKGLIRRSYGRITATRRSTELPVSLRLSQNTEAKRRIGALASSLIPPRTLTVALGGGSTVGFVARNLAARRDLTVVTNGLDTATCLTARQTVNVVVTGGTARPLSNDLVGKAAEQTLRSYQFDFAVVGTDGVSPKAGFTQHSPSGAEIDRIMLEQAECGIIVADSSKLGKVHKTKFADIASLHTMVTDSHANADMVAFLRKSGLNTILVVIPPDAGFTQRAKPGVSPKPR
ncbi:MULTISPECIES: DeoR/GlpR family DNA-binding transcription regulator [unclassified Streptomyces]|uniref:DeoR/GlpR family DNA-binding transcription regulator n=1 Tax=unclassified Streptomyces TaxID=2593676 RepID=UPI0033BC3779